LRTLSNGAESGLWYFSIACASVKFSLLISIFNFVYKLDFLMNYIHGNPF